MANVTLTTWPPLPPFTRESAGFHMFRYVATILVAISRSAPLVAESRRLRPAFTRSGAIPKSGGKLATSTKRLVSLIACLSNDAIRVARDSTNASRSESGNDRLL